MRFTKMHGSGNDYVYVDCFRETLAGDLPKLGRRHQRPALRRRRRRADPDLPVRARPTPGCACSTPTAARRRCAATASAASPSTSTTTASPARTDSTIETGRGVLTLDLEVKGGKVERVRVDMGEPILEAAKIPTTLPGDPPIEQTIAYGPEPSARSRSPACRWATRTRSRSSTRSPTQLVHQVGPLVETHAAFPRRMNVEFVKVNRRTDADMRVWERGSGETLACGTGACAVCVAGVLTGRTDRKVTIHLLGGDLELDWGADNHVYKTGPAVEVFSGEWPG